MKKLERICLLLKKHPDGCFLFCVENMRGQETSFKGRKHKHRVVWEKGALVKKFRCAFGTNLKCGDV